MEALKKVPGELIHLTISLLFILGAFGITPAGNIAGFLTWICILLCLVGFFVCEPDDLFSKMKKRPRIKILYALSVVVMVMCGWLITAVFSLISYGLMWSKKQAWLEEQKASL